MADLDLLAVELRRQLGSPPAALLAAQRARIVEGHGRALGRRRRFVPIGLAIAGCAALLLIVIATRSGSPDASTAGATRAIAAEHAPLRLTLDDGTSIQLERGSRGAITERSDQGVRLVLERGRADFQVAPQHGRHFSVAAGRHEISVLGTHFVVHFEPPADFGVTVEHGLVSVRAAGEREIRLSAGQSFETGAPPPPPALPVPDQAPSAAVVPAEPGTAIASSGDAVPARPTWRELYSRRDYRGAMQAARELGFAQLTTSLGARELTELADAARLAGTTSEALLALRALERRFSSAEQGRQATFLIGRVLLASGNTGEAVEAFERYRRSNPNGTYTTEAIGRLMELYAERQDTGRARDMARRYLARAPTGPYQRLARSLLPAP